MLYLFHGSGDVRGRAQALVAGLRKKRPDATLVRLEAESYSREALEALAGMQGLFVSKCIVLLDHLAAGEHMEEFLPLLERCATSENIFVAVEGTLTVSALAAYSAHAHEVREVNISTTNQVPPAAFNVFALADALAQKNRMRLWTLLMEAFRSGLSGEEIAGTLFWQVKTLALAKGARSAEEAGLKPFVFGKAGKAGARFSEEELRQCAHDLVTIYHDAHEGRALLPLALEAWVLRLG